jgi:hypothetical protein
LAQLKPNCLLTKRPLKLVSGPRSLFFYRKPWGDLPEVLYEHGYKVEVFHLPFNNSQARQKIFTLRLADLHNSHVVIDSVTAEEFKNQISHIENSTITVIGRDFTPDYHPISFSYWLHQRWLSYLGYATVSNPENLFIKAPLKVHYAFIDHCVRLAELDFLS